MIDSGVPRGGWRFMSMEDNQKRDTFARWLDKEVDPWQRSGVEARIKTTLRFLRFAKKDLWKLPHFRWLGGGIGEIRSDYNNVEYRPLGCDGPYPDQFTILLGASKKGKVWTPPDARKIAQGKRKQLLRTPKIGTVYEIKL